jgi:hypothetical protein
MGTACFLQLFQRLFPFTTKITRIGEFGSPYTVDLLKLFYYTGDLHSLLQRTGCKLSNQIVQQ